LFCRRFRGEPPQGRASRDESRPPIRKQNHLGQWGKELRLKIAGKSTKTGSGKSGRIQRYGEKREKNKKLIAANTCRKKMARLERNLRQAHRGEEKANKKISDFITRKNTTAALKKKQKKGATPHATKLPKRKKTGRKDEQ